MIQHNDFSDGDLAPERWRRVKQLFEQTVNRLPGDRDAYLLSQCAGDPGLSDTVRRMLSAHERAGAFLDTPALGEGFHVSSAANASADLEFVEGQHIGEYEIVRRIASGGMGSVYEAIQANPRRAVAIKVMRSGMSSPAAHRRFEYESLLLAKLRHPGIAQVYEASTFEGPAGSIPYIVLEYIEGGAGLTSYAQDQGLDVTDRLNLLLEACDAIHFAHQRGIVHRDIKPANILVDASGQLKLIDFGVARSLGPDPGASCPETGVTDLIGTLQYMSPEQCGARDEPVDLRSDVYSLGIVMYELLAGRRLNDWRDLSFYQAVRRVQEELPPRPSHVAPLLRGDLDAIILKALEKCPADRYQSAAELGDDIRAYIQRRPIRARPPSSGYYLRKWVQRHRVAALSATLSFVVFVLGAAMLTVQSFRIAEERDSARRQAQKADRVSGFLRSILSYANPKTAGYDVSMREVIDAAVARIPAELGDDPEVEADVRWQIGAEVYWPMMRLDRAVREMSASIHLSEDTIGPEHPTVTCAKAQLADLLIFKQDFEQAAKVLDELRAVAGDDNDLMIAVHDGLGRIASADGNLEDATRFFESAQAERGALHGTVSVSYAEGLQRLAELAMHKGDVSHAIDLQQRAVDTRLSALGEADGAVAEQKGYLAHMLLARGSKSDIAYAESLCRESMMIFESLNGKNDLEYAWALSYLAPTLTAQGQHAAALQAYKDAIAIKRRIVGSRHVEVANSLAALADLHGKLGHRDECVGAYREALDIRVDIFGRVHRDVRCNADKLYRALLASGETVEADDVFAEFGLDR